MRACGLLLLFCRIFNGLIIYPFVRCVRMMFCFRCVIAWGAFIAHRGSMLKQHFVKFAQSIFILAAVGGMGCSTVKSPYLSGEAGLPLPVPDAPKKQTVQRRPWEVWVPARDLNGAHIVDSRILAADRLYVDGAIANAAEQYAAIRSNGLPPNERAALALRTASTQLTLDQSTRALSTLSTFFRAEGRSADDVDSTFALLFGYAYGRSKDLEQSFAWFSRADRTGGAGGVSEAAAQGVRYFLAAVPVERFDALDQTWGNDEFVHRLIGEERYRRRSGGAVVALDRTDALWAGSALAPQPVQKPVSAGSGATTIGVLLPLSGRYNALGASAKNGIDLALQGQPDRDLLVATYKDTGEDPVQALVSTQELLTVARAPVVIGPLLSEQVSAVTGVVKQFEAAMVSFSKRSDAELGDGVFRLGTTVESQVGSLAEAAVKKLGLRRIAIVAPSDLAGQEHLNVFAQKLRALGVEPAYQTSYAKEDMNALVAIAQEVEAQSIDGIFFPDSLTAASRFFSSLAPAARQRIRPLGLAVWDNPVQLANSRTVLAGAVFVSLFFAESTRPTVSQFMQSYLAQFRTKPDFLAAQGFDAATLVATAVAQQRLTGARFADALGSIGTYEGLTGAISVDGNGELRRTFAVVELRNDALVELTEPITPSFVMRGNEAVDLVASSTPQTETGSDGKSKTRSGDVSSLLEELGREKRG